MGHKSFTNHFLLFIGVLTLAHVIQLLALQFVIIPKPEAYEPLPLWWWLLILIPIYLIHIMFGLGIKSWGQFAAYALAAVLMWQGFIYAYDWLWKRAFPVPYFSLEPWFMVKLRQILIPLSLVCVGALLGWLKGRSRLR